MRFYLFLILTVVATLCVLVKKSSSFFLSSDEGGDQCDIDCSNELCTVLDPPSTDLVCGEGQFTNVNHVVRARVVAEIDNSDITRREYDIELLEIVRSDENVAVPVCARLKVSACITAPDCVLVPDVEYFLFVEKFKVKDNGKIKLKFTDESECFVWFRQATAAVRFAVDTAVPTCNNK